MKAKRHSPRQRLAGANLIGFDTSVWKNPLKRDLKSGVKGQRSKILAAKAGNKGAWRKQNAPN
jgi:hypothetical protein